MASGARHGAAPFELPRYTLGPCRSRPFSTDAMQSGISSTAPLGLSVSRFISWFDHEWVRWASAEHVVGGGRPTIRRGSRGCLSSYRCGGTWSSWCTACGASIVRSAACAPSRSRGPMAREPMGRPVGAEQTRLRQDPGIAAVGLDFARARRIHRRAVRVAMMTSCPRPSRQRATHALSVEASMTPRARGRVSSTAAKRSASVRMRRSITSPPSAST